MIRNNNKLFWSCNSRNTSIIRWLRRSLICFEAYIEVLARRYLDTMHQSNCLKGRVIVWHIHKTKAPALACSFVYHRVDGGDGTKRRKEFVDRHFVTFLFKIWYIETPPWEMRVNIIERRTNMTKHRTDMDTFFREHFWF